MIDPHRAPSVSRQCALLGVQRSTYYYHPKEPKALDLEHMRLIDQIHLRYPFLGSRRISDELAEMGHVVNRKRVQRLMRQMGITALYPKRSTSTPAPGHKIYPYLLRGVSITRPNHVWCTDITFIPMARGFVYLVAIMDWASRKVLSWRISTSMDTQFCLEALGEAMDRYGKPEIFNTDQGSQFTSEDFTGYLQAAGVQISMDGRGRWLDNVFIERLWRSVKYEEVYLHAYDSVEACRGGLERWFAFYNERRHHQSLSRQTPDEAFGEIVRARAA